MAPKKARKTLVRSKRLFPKMVPDIAYSMEQWTAQGKSTKEIAAELGVDEGTLYRWTSEHEELREAVKRGRHWMLQRVIESMFRRATGYDYEEIKQVGATAGVDPKTGKPIPKSTRLEKIVKHVPPDVRAATLLLKSLLPEEFRDKPVPHENEQMNLCYDGLALRDEQAGE